MATAGSVTEDGAMSSSRRTLTLLGLGGLALAATSACSVDVSIGTLDGSGQAETVSFDFDSFDEISLNSAFGAEITVVEGPPSVEVTVDDNLVEHLEVNVENDELTIGFDRGNIDTDVNPIAVVSMPSLTKLDLSGASTAQVDGVDESELSVDISGAGDLTIAGSVDELRVDLSGGSTMSVTGTGDRVVAELSGASDVDFTDFETASAEIDFSGASNGTFGPLTSVSGEMSGASSLSVPDDADVSVDTSGGSSVSRN